MQRRSRIALAAASMITAAVLLAACNRAGDQRTAGQRVDDGIARTEQKADEIGADVRQAGQAASAAAGHATEVVQDKARDMAITTKLNAQLAKDRQLSALRIDVDTADGRVTLRGSAPTLSARERATELARGIDGVVGVQNELQVQANSGNPS